jgi:phage terminase large subunit-like protein
VEGVLDDSWFAFIAAADEDDDWTDSQVWRKANPSFGISVKADDLARKAEKAIALPGAQNAFRRMHLNEWTEQAERWIDLAAWDACAAPVDLEGLRGRSCLGGLDLSTTTDVTALGWLPAEEDDGRWYLLSRYFVPEDDLRNRAERDRVPYDLWTRQGFIEATPGNVVDYGAVEQRILADSAQFQVKEIAYDPWNATHIALRLDLEALEDAVPGHVDDRHVDRAGIEERPELAAAEQGFARHDRRARGSAEWKRARPDRRNRSRATSAGRARSPARPRDSLR